MLDPSSRTDSRTHRIRQVGRIARDLIGVVCGCPSVRLPMPMSQNMRNRCSGVRLIQSRRGRDR
ncbi:hypothetical protein BRM05_16195, partial [Xanthomonas oryzae pv. oryzae]